jgi:hypothetical protein
MSQTFDPLKPTSGVTKLSQLYQIIRDHDQANRSSFSGTTAPSSPVVGQHFYNTDEDILYVYTAGGWKEVVNEGYGIGLEVLTKGWMPS